MSPNTPAGSHRANRTGRVAGALVLAGLVGFRELQRARAAPKPAPARRRRLGVYRARHKRRRRGRAVARTCFVLSAAGVVALPVVWFSTRPESGATVTVDYQDGSSRAWRVVARRQYPKSELPLDMLFARTGDPTLALVTCGGLFDASKRSYRDNVVVFAVLVT